MAQQKQQEQQWSPRKNDASKNYYNCPYIPPPTTYTSDWQEVSFNDTYVYSAYLEARYV
jgi:hypothetical protein